MTLRRMQMKLASEGNATMQIWLGKQLLGQRNVQGLEANGGPTGTQIQLVVMQTGTRIDAQAEQQPVLDITSLLED